MRTQSKQVSGRWTLALLVLIAPGAVHGQSEEAGRSLSGRVIDARTGEPLPGSMVVLTPAPGGFVNDGRAGPLLEAGLTTVTDADGGYAFGRLSPGTYTLYVTRLAYKPVRLDLEVSRADLARVSVGLVIEPIAMEPQSVVLRQVSPASGAPPAPATAARRVALEQARQRAHLTSDARGLSRDDLDEAITLAETDLFRAFQRLPGVTTRDDYTAELWSRGAPWSHTRVLFDGMPLFNPLHGAGVFSGVNSDAIAGAFFLPGARSAAIGEGAAAVIDLTSRPAGGQGELRGSGELSLVTARAALDQRFQDGRGGWMIAGRRSYLDFVTLAIEALGGGSDIHVPYAFHDLAGRLDVRLPAGAGLEASALWEEDAVRGEIPDVLEKNRSRWGNTAARVTLETPWGPLRLRHTIGGSRFYARVSQEEEALPDTLDPLGGSDPQLFDAVTEEPTRNVLTYATLQGDIGSRDTGRAAGWRAGYALVSQSQEYEGPRPTPHPGRTSLHRLVRSGDLRHLALWGERRFEPTRGLEIQLGMRVEAGTGLSGSRSVRPAPRITARYAVAGPRLLASAGYARTVQYAQAVAPTGLSVGPRLHPSDLWLVAGDSVPFLESEIVTVGAEGWVGTAWIAAITVYDRRAEGLTVPDPRPGPIDPEGPTFEAGENHARGVELSLRRLVGRWTGSLSYTYGTSTVSAEGRTYPASSERRHVVDASVLARVSDRWRLGAAYTWAGGAPFTRFFGPRFACEGGEGPACAIERPARVEEPNAERGPAYSALDAVVDWTRKGRGWDLTVFAQIRNLLNRANAVTYQGSRCAGSEDASGRCAGPPRDDFDRGLPILPTVGLRVAF